MPSMVSVIVPVYNGEQTIGRCLDSLLAQTWQNLEILVVDGSSTDGSMAILREYARRDARVQVFCRDKMGVARSRNFAISCASGEYIQFADCDDWVPPEATERMVRAMEQGGCDLVIGGYNEYIGALESSHSVIREDAVMTQEAFLDRFSRHPNAFYYSVLWNKLYRRSVVLKHQVYCDPDLDWGEDFAFNVSYYRWARSVAVITDPVYNYVRSMTGLTIAMTRRCLREPLHGVRMKVLQYRRYVTLYKNVGLYESYRRRLLRYLYSFALTN